jgi:hypothetical protein
MFRQVKILYSQRDHLALRDFWKELDYLGYKIFNTEMISASESYLQLLIKIMSSEINEISKMRRILRRDAFKNRNHSIADTLDRIFQSEFEYDRIRSVTNLGVIAAKKRMDSVLDSLLYSMRGILETVLVIEDRIVRRSLLYSIIQSLTKINQVSVDMEKNNNLWTTDWLHIYVEKIGSKYPHDSKLLVQSFCKMSVYSIEHGFFEEIRSLGDNGVLLINKNPELVLTILDTLHKAVEIINRKEQDAEIKSTQISKVIDEIKSIRNSDKNNHPSIIEKTKNILDDIGNS